MQLDARIIDPSSTAARTEEVVVTQVGSPAFGPVPLDKTTGSLVLASEKYDLDRSNRSSVYNRCDDSHRSRYCIPAVDYCDRLQEMRRVDWN
ncbi:hypothetical protein JTB14_037474 [Gonioctena quinquepunctata]|nr:hypothetical protein JTB14_037474 [Gonioctena quinquepunctata]